ncbi:MAG TPA: SRPBCC domain-containing protein [Polyangiaceae bacterium]|nr:SRPBCC domain-containing protein [Polyangiaceae bacterium]
MVNIIHRVGIKAPIADVYAAISTIEGIASWWTKDTTGSSNLGGSVRVRFHTPTGEEMGKMEFDVAELNPDRDVRWHFTAGPEEWLGTEVTFSLARSGDYTSVIFGHRNWREPVEFMAHCSTKWATFLLSLKALLEQGQGRPAPQDLKIDSWN